MWRRPRIWNDSLSFLYDQAGPFGERTVHLKGNYSELSNKIGGRKNDASRLRVLIG